MKITVYKLEKPAVNDPYTIIIDRCDKDWPREMWGMTEEGSWYFCSTSEDRTFQVGNHLGRKVPMHKLPIQVQKSILNNLIVIEE